MNRNENCVPNDIPKIIWKSTWNITVLDTSINRLEIEGDWHFSEQFFKL